MKKQTLFLLTAGVVALASCQNDSGSGFTQGQVDSMVDARVEELRLEMEASNDSVIFAQATLMADSMYNAMKSGKKVTTGKSSGTSGKTSSTTSSNPKADRFNGTKTSNTDEKAARFGDEDAKKKVSEESTKKKAERFKK